ncbi:sigma-70 family RNA polymerase sigma factor [Ornithinibacillus contaminans]|uniref:sigma-70 family RNA polymerase sigma factor n=1 Tax=Ornithinibacillus contaminans TaxID=694055 RepID=UPI00064D9447|nr:sigma-70 family RNA polymerase sigma factor [Ornithinibacillus contaminans]
MEPKRNFTFEEIFKQNEKRIHYHIHKLGLQDPHQEYYVEGMYAMWNAYKNYQPDKGPMSTYFNYVIRNRLIDMLRKVNRDKENQVKVIQEEMTQIDSGNRNVKTGMPIETIEGIVLADEGVWEELQSLLSSNQMKWVEGRVLGLSTCEIALREGVSEDAVKSWGREVRRKMRQSKGKEI